jgi:hypothetical protein
VADLPVKVLTVAIAGALPAPISMIGPINLMQLVEIQKDLRDSPSDSAEPQIAHKDLIIRYLTGAPRVAAIRTFVYDEIEPERRNPISLAFHSDGTWVWSNAITYYVEQYNVHLPPPFTQLILEAREPPSSLTDALRDEAMSVAHASI